MNSHSKLTSLAILSVPCGVLGNGRAQVRGDLGAAVLEKVGGEGEEVDACEAGAGQDPED